MLAMTFLNPEGDSGQHGSPPTQSSRWSAPRCLWAREKGRHESCASSGRGGAGTALPPDTPLPAARLSVYRGKPLPDLAYAFFILLSNKHLLSTYAVLGTGDAVQNTRPRPPLGHQKGLHGFPLCGRQLSPHISLRCDRVLAGTCVPT